MSANALSPVGEKTSRYPQLAKQIRDAGLLRRRPWYYAWRISATVAAYAAAWAVFVLVGDSWWQLFTAAAMAVTFMQFGFLGHDAGHQQIFGSRRGNSIVGYLLGNLGLGLSFGWWSDKHTRHHANPNVEGRDPDLNVDPVAFTDAQAARSRGIGKQIVRFQAALFIPLLFLEAFHMHFNSLRRIVNRNRPIRARGLEAVLFTVHVVAYLGIVFTVLSPGTAVVFIFVHQGLLGVYMGASFAPNHKGMPVLTDGEQADFLLRQVLTARNIDGGRFVDAALGGLNYQIEHHLFPHMPRPNLRQAQPVVRQFCAEHDIAYCQTSMFGSWGRVLGHLHDMGRDIRNPGSP
ncbi:fatty acid desaturase family protein [Stackebrandtia nassauensis]|uniref:Fatty acid desaturase n=1 Tax=Stackebrandtia nassauensis (strain DSM 44728 / CIP 108903 / NRRL B-16338 / NBRC 102104 / LLR-40K-21) TaxID=446470 RepID=D3Q8T0_STANL|nr:acyl-CoA desaturase [Stackebrandtia nassauensis]ADD44522.1 fatty acid desaturase [Stackebrandtia nassauensis DSM 44728]